MMQNLRTCRVLRYDPRNHLLRIGRIMWERGTVGSEGSYSVKLTLGLRPSLLSWRRESTGWLLTVLGLRLHYDRSYGGRHV